MKNRLIIEVNGLSKIEAGSPMSREVLQKHNAVYNEVLRFVEYRQSKIKDPTSVVSLIQQININLLDATTIRMLGSIVGNYAGTDLMQFPNVDLDQVARNQGYTQEARDYFRGPFLNNFSQSGNARTVFNYISRQPLYMQVDFEEALVGCAKGGEW